MRANDPKPRFDPRSPVQPNRSRTEYLVVGLVVLAFVGWLVSERVTTWIAQEAGIGTSPQDYKEARAAERPNSARGDVRAIFSADDYPIQALKNGEEGTVQARLDVDRNGNVSSCTILRSSGHESLDAATCSILRKRARFAPAHDAGGDRVADEVTTPPIVWRLEE